MNQNNHHHALDLRLPNPITPKLYGKLLKKEPVPACGANSKRVGRFWFEADLTPQQTARLMRLNAFYTETLLRNVVVPLVSNHSIISLRALDWFVINYAKENQIALQPPNGHVVTVYSEYRDWLRFHKRSLYDAFRRGPRIYFQSGNRGFATTVAQLNYLYWALNSGVLCYAVNNLAVIQAHKTSRISQCKKQKNKSKTPRKRAALSNTARPMAVIYTLAVEQQFKPSADSFFSKA